MTEAEINNIVASYEAEYGLNWNQTSLTRISLDKGLFKGFNVESVLNIFLFEQFDDDECYQTEKREFVDDEYLEKHPDKIVKLIKENIQYY